MIPGLVLEGTCAFFETDSFVPASARWKNHIHLGGGVFRSWPQVIDKVASCFVPYVPIPASSFYLGIVAWNAALLSDCPLRQSRASPA